jgi:hypothetical protein
MARIRSVSPELRISEATAEWPREVRYAWVLLWGYLDDHGRGVDNTRIIAADCFPLDDDVTPGLMGDWLERFEKSGCICRYEVAGKRYLHAVNWSEYQKPQHPGKVRIPPCPLHEPGPHKSWSDAHQPALMTSSGDSHETVPRVSPTRGRGRGSKELSKEGEGARGAPPVAYPAHCPRHAQTALPGKCGDCKDARVAYEARPQLALVDQRPPWCGRCAGPNDRHLETPHGVIRCPECNPLATEV